MDGISELLRGRILGFVWPQVRVVGFVPVGAPVPFVLAAVGIEHDHAMIAVPIRDDKLI